MKTLHISRHINAPPEIVFATASDFARFAEFVPGIERVDLCSAETIGAGTRFRETRKMFGREATEEMTITRWDPPHAFALEADSCGSLFSSLHRITPDIAGTLLELQIDTQPQTLMAKLTAPLGALFAGSMRKMIDADLDAVQAEAERRAEVTAGDADGEPAGDSVADSNIS